MRKLPGNALAFLLGCLAAAALLEIFLRLHNPLPMRVKASDVVLPANRTFTFENTHIPRLERKITCTKNALGFRGENPPDGFDSHLTILAVGGSTTECRLLSDGKDWSARLLAGLRAKFPGKKIWLNNAGMDGHSTYGHLILLKNHLCQLRPDFVLYLTGINEIGREDLFADDQAIVRSRSFSAADWLRKNCETVILANNLWRTWRAHQVDLAHGALDLAALPHPFVSELRVDSLLRSHEPFISACRERLVRLVLETRRCGSEPVLLTQPLLFGEGLDDATGVSLATAQTRFFNGQAYWQLLERYNDATRAVALENKARLVDLACEMPKSSALFYDAMHFTEAGARVVGEVVAEQFGCALER